MKSTIFKSKIQTRSEAELKIYFQKWLEQAGELGYLNPARFAPSAVEEEVKEPPAKEDRVEVLPP